MTKLLQSLKDGCSTMEIIEETPAFGFKARDIDTLRETMNAAQYRSQNRDLTVYYLYGASGAGKTRGIYAEHPATDICRITDYGGRNGVRFDAYHGQPVLVFEEFHSQIPIESMLNYLDIYPLTLPARYSDRVAAIQRSISPPTFRWRNSIRRYRDVSWKPGGPFCGVSMWYGSTGVTAQYRRKNMTRNEKQNRQRRTAHRDFWRSFPMGLVDLSDLPMKLPFVILYFIGSVWFWASGMPP